MPQPTASVDWKGLLLEAGTRLEDRWDELRRAVWRELGGGIGPVTILPYRGHGDAGRLWLRGRVLESKEGRLVTPQAPAGTAWDNLVRMLHRFETDEVPHARVQARFGERWSEVTADEEGYFEVAFDALGALEPDPPAGQRWREVALELLAPLPPGPPGDGDPVRATAQVLTPPATARLGVISDVDDTILQTGATDLVRNWRTILLHSAESRIPFRGVAAFYRALERGTGAEPINPIFYVSSSPWNLYDLLKRFMEVHGIPAGPMYLRDFGLDRTKLVTGSHERHKLEAIERLFAFYPALSFVLVGDSGQHDAAIYAELVRRHPGRVRAVYIRDVTASEETDQEAHALLEAVRRAGTRVTFCSDLLEAAADAANQGWITADAVAEVRREIDATAVTA
jgi:phosphatidate phosphatase APP1